MGLLTAGYSPCILLHKKGQAVRLLVVHMPGGVDYRTNGYTFTVSRAGQGRRPWASALAPSLLPHHHSPITMHRWQERCWRSCVGRWASGTPRRWRNLPSSSSKGKVGPGTKGKSGQAGSGEEASAGAILLPTGGGFCAGVAGGL